MLYNKHNYLNKNIDYLISHEIIEYDMKSAGFNLIKKFKLLDEQKINYLETLGKKQQTIQIGMYQRQDRELVKRMNEKFIEARKWFFEQNELKDEDILSIKKDAIVTTRRCLVTEWDNVIFVEKNVYTSYYYINNFEFYYNRNGIDVKGISEDLLELHTEYMLDFLYNFFRMHEVSSHKKVIELLMDFSHYYRERRLDIGYYRELSRQSLFRVDDRFFGDVVGIKHIGDVKKIDIGYNYMHYIVPLISILV